MHLAPPSAPHYPTGLYCFLDKHLVSTCYVPGLCQVWGDEGTRLRDQHMNIHLRTQKLQALFGTRLHFHFHFSPWNKARSELPAGGRGVWEGRRACSSAAGPSLKQLYGEKPNYRIISHHRRSLPFRTSPAISTDSVTSHILQDAS